MTDDGLDALVAPLASPDWTRVKDAVDALGARLRDGAIPGAQVATLASHLVGLSAHPKWEVRKAVAHAAEHLPLGPFFAAVAPLRDDEHVLVQEAARRALARRTELTRADPLTEEHEDLLAGWLAALEDHHGPRSRKAAVDLARKYAEALIREAKHEISRVLSPIELQLRSLDALLREKKIPTTRARAKVKRARELVALLDAIVTSLRNLTTEVTPEHRPERLRELVDEAIDVVRDRRGARARRLVTTVRIPRDLTLDAHRARLVQAFANVVENGLDAYRALPRPPRLAIAARRDAASVTVTVADRGCGMTDAVARDAFHLFSTNKPDGTGVGLPLARKIVQQEHRGTIWLDSVKGEGTTVTIVLPLVQEDGS